MHPEGLRKIILFSECGANKQVSKWTKSNYPNAASSSPPPSKEVSNKNTRICAPFKLLLYFQNSGEIAFFP